jgi:2'-5' RNA ligase
VHSIEENFMDGKFASDEFMLSKRASKHTTAIVAIKVPKHIVKKLKNYVDEDTQPSKELHITLAFLGKSKDISKSTRKAIISALEKICSKHKPLSMYISGTGKFQKNEDGTPIFLIPNAIGLSRLQADIENTLSNFIDLPSEHGWVPHITVQYSKDDTVIPELKSFPKWKTNNVVLWFSGSEIAEIPLGKKQAFFISKRAQELELKAPGAQILIEPYDSAVAQALAKLPAELKQNVTKIIVHPEGGPGQLGHVEMGPGKDPREIHLFKNRINEQVKRMFGTTQPDPQQLEQATHRALVETLTHEGVHIGPATQEQILDPSYRFKDESGTEQETAQRMRTLFPEMAMAASLKLDDIRAKFLPSQPMTEPDLEFMVCCALDRKFDTIKKGISLLKNAAMKPAILEIKDAIEFNKQASRDRNVIRMIGALGTCTKPDEVLSLACWQLRNKLEPTGKLDRKTVQKFGKTITIYELPRNFGVVVPKQLYRGGIIENPLQIKNLKDRFGVERIISLHNHPEIGRMCREVGIEHIPAPIETGAPEEYGRKILGDKVSKLLLEKPTYIHCWYGADRTGGVIARFRTETGWPNKEAYLEAKSYGFKDMFADLIDWFCEVGKGSPPVNTRMIRRMLNRLHRDPNCPYRNPEISNDKDTYKKRIIRRVLNRLHKDPVEQDAFTPAGTPTDEPFRDLSETWPRYERWSDTVRSVNPVMTMTPPAGVTGH